MFLGLGIKLLFNREVEIKKCNSSIKGPDGEPLGCGCSGGVCANVQKNTPTFRFKALDQDTI